MCRSERGEILSAAAIISMIVLSLISVITISQYQQRQTYRSSALEYGDPATTKPPNASPTKLPTKTPTKPLNPTSSPTGSSVPSLPSNTCKYGSYSDSPSSIRNCNNSCIVACTKCRIGSTPKWECPMTNPTEAAKSGIPKCGNVATYNDPANCQKDTGCKTASNTPKNCSSCTISDPYGGAYTKWFCNTGNLPAGPTWNPNKLTPTITPKATIKPTIKPQNTIKPDPTTNPKTICTLGNQKFSVGQILCYNGFNYECIVTNNEAKPSKTESKCGIHTTPIPIQQKNCRIGTNILSVGQTICYNGYWQTCVYNEYSQAVPNIGLPCDKPHSTVIPTVDPTKAAAADPLYPTIQSIRAQRFVYPQTTYQQALTGLQTANTGEQIDCNVNTCVEK